MNITVNKFPNIEADNMDDPIPKKKRVKVEYVILVAGLDRKRFPVHRQTMIESSKYFQAMLGPNFREGNEEEIVLHGINGTTLQHLIDFSYAGGTTITTDNIEELIDAAASMEFVELEQECCKFLMDNLSLENFLDALFFADKYSFEKLNQKALNLIRDHFEDIPIVDLLEISYENFVELLKYEHFKIEECVLFDRLAQWVGHNKTERAKHVPSLVKHIQMQHITDEFFFEKIKPFYDNHDCNQILAGELKRLLQPHTPTRLCRYRAKELYFSVPSYTGIEFLKFDTNSKRWKQHKKIQIRRNRDFGSIFIGDKFYIIGGISNGSPLNKVILHDLGTDSRVELPNIPEARSHFAPVTIGKYIYVFGGITDSYTDKCIRFDTELCVWEPLQSMPYSVRNYDAIELNGKIYVAGGLIANSVYSHRFCCYDPTTDTWTEKRQTVFEMSSLVLFRWKQSIYAASMDAIIRRYNAEADTWDMVGRIHTNELINNAIECNDELYAFIRGPKFSQIKIGENYCTVNPICDAPFRTGIECLFFMK